MLPNYITLLKVWINLLIPQNATYVT